MIPRQDHLFGLLAVQTGLLDAVDFLDACEQMTEGLALPDLLVQRGLILPEDRDHLGYLVRRKLPAAEPTPVTAATVAAPAAHTDRYRVLDLCGSGGIGDVWRAHDRRLDREVAIKELALDQGEGDPRRVGPAGADDRRQPRRDPRPQGGRPPARRGPAAGSGQRAALPPADRADSPERLDAHPRREAGLSQPARPGVGRPEHGRNGRRRLASGGPPRRPAGLPAVAAGGDGGRRAPRAGVPCPRRRWAVPLVPLPRRPVRDEQGRIVQWFGTNTDVHDLEQARRQRDEALARLRALEAR